MPNTESTLLASDESGGGPLDGGRARQLAAPPDPSSGRT
jgi:hypothetical protein